MSSTADRYRQCLPLCRHANGDIGEVASLRAEGVDRQPQSGFSAKIGKTATLILAEPLRLRHLPYPRYRAAEEDIATYPLSTAHHTLTENTPYRSNRRGGHCCASITHSQTSLHVCPTSPITQPSILNPKTGKVASLRIKKRRCVFSDTPSSI